MEYITLKSYDGKMVRVPYEKKEKYLQNQNKIKSLIKEGKNIDEIMELLKNG